MSAFEFWFFFVSLRFCGELIRCGFCFGRVYGLEEERLLFRRLEELWGLRFRKEIANIDNLVFLFVI